MTIEERYMNFLDECEFWFKRADKARDKICYYSKEKRSHLVYNHSLKSIDVGYYEPYEGICTDDVSVFRLLYGRPNEDERWKNYLVQFGANLQWIKYGNGYRLWWRTWHDIAVNHHSVSFYNEEWGCDPVVTVGLEEALTHPVMLEAFADARKWFETHSWAKKNGRLGDEKDLVIW